MAKRNNNSKTEPTRGRSAHKEPVLTHAAYKATLAVLVLGLIAQLVMAFIVYPTLPAQIPSGWTGSAQPFNHVSKAMVFVLFPGFELVTLLIAIFSPKDAEGKRVMTSGNALTFVLLALVFTALESSAFFINR